MAAAETGRVRVLLVEDSVADAELILRELRLGDVNCHHERVDTQEAWDHALSEPAAWDIVLLDYSIPQLDTLCLLAELRERAPDMPAIVVSGTVTEESAVAALRAGAKDFITKQNLVRLAPAVVREVAAAFLLREGRAVEAALGESEARLARLIGNAQDIVYRFRLQPEAAYDYVSPSVQTTLGYAPDDFYADPALGLRIIHPDDRAAVAAAYAADPEGPVTARFVASNGGIVWLDRRQVAIRDEQGQIVALEAVARDVTEQVLAHEQVRLREREFRAVFEGALDGLLLVGDDRVCVDANPAVGRLLGVPLDEIVGRRAEDFGDPTAGPDLGTSWAVLLSEGRQEGEHIFVRPDGELRTTEFRATANVVPGVHLFVLRDVTVRKAQERKLARSEERFRLAQEGAQMGTWDIDLVTGEMTWSEGLREVYGVGPDYPAGLEGFAQLVHPDDRERVARLVLTGERRGERVEFECRIVRPNGALRWILSRSTPIWDDDRTLIRVLGIGVDITDRKRAEEDLVRRDETLRLAQTAAQLGAWDLNLETGELHWTEGMYEIFGLGPAHVPSLETLQTYIAPDDWNILAAEIRRVLASEESSLEGACRVLRPSGDTRWVVSRGTVVRGADGRATRMTGVTFDDTERRGREDERHELETRLRQSEKLESVGRLAGGVAHDFNNLLLAIRGHGELALDRLAHGEEGVAQDIDVVLTATDKAAVLTRQLLAFGRGQVLNPEVLDLNDVVRETNALLTRVIGDNIELVTILEQQPIIVKADRGQLEQVIMNLAVNGRDAMPHGGVLTVQATTVAPEEDSDDAGAHEAVLCVADEGSGIEAETASHIFEPFFTTKGDLGTGLGLATVHGIVAQSGGRVTLDTELGRGSTFKVYLPICNEEVPMEAAIPPTSAGGTETILLVEDDPAVRSVVSTMLTARGYEVVHAAGGAEAVAFSGTFEHPIQLVLSDLMMPGLTGQQTVERIRESRPAILALYMSGYTNDPMIQLHTSGPKASFIQKPFSGNEIAGRVRELLDGALKTP